MITVQPLNQENPQGDDSRQIEIVQENLEETPYTNLVKSGKADDQVSQTAGAMIDQSSFNDKSSVDNVRTERDGFGDTFRGGSGLK